MAGLVLRALKRKVGVLRAQPPAVRVHGDVELRPRHEHLPPARCAQRTQQPWLVAVLVAALVAAPLLRAFFDALAVESARAAAATHLST